MRIYNIAIGILGMFVLVLVVTGFILAGNPVSQRDVQIDTAKINDFNSIRYAIDNHYQRLKSLPNSLAQLENYAPVTNRQTNQTYEYVKMSDIRYKLCTDFLTDTETNNKLPARPVYYPDFEPDIRHKKGYDCIEYMISPYLLSPTPTPFVENFQPSPTPTPVPIR